MLPHRRLASSSARRSGLELGLRRRALALALCTGTALLGAPGSAQRRASALEVEVEGETLSLTARDIPVGEIVAAIARETGLRVTGSELGGERVSLHVERVSLTEALARILGHRSYLVAYVPPLDSARSSLWLLPTIGVDEPSSTSAFAVDGRSADFAALAAVHATRDSEVAAEAAASAAAASDPIVRAEAARALGGTDSDAAVEELRVLLTDDEREVRRAAIDALATIGSDRAVGALATALSVDDRETRSSGVDALAGIGSPLALALLQQALGDSDSTVRESAATYVSGLMQIAQ